MTKMCEICLKELRPKQIRRGARFCSKECYYQSKENKSIQETVVTLPDVTTEQQEKIHKNAVEWVLMALVYFKRRGEQPTRSDINTLSKRLQKELNLPAKEVRQYVNYGKQTIGF